MTGRERSIECASVSQGELRCACGRLLAKACDDGIELKCPRCKRAIVIPWSALAAGEVSVELCKER